MYRVQGIRVYRVWGFGFRVRLYRGCKSGLLGLGYLGSLGFEGGQGLTQKAVI